MKKITALRTRNNRRKQINLFLDDEYAFSLEADVVVKEGLQVNQTLSEEEIEKLADANQFQRCFNAAAQFLSYRPRSEPELKRRLLQHGFKAEYIEAVISRMKQMGLVDDAAFARFWTENRESFSPRSRQLTRLELRHKGLTDDIIDQVVSTIDDEESAYRAAVKKARNLSRSDFQSFKRRLGEHLRRRGFSYEVIKDTILKIWQEQPSDSN